MKVENPRKEISEHKMELRVSSEVDFLLLKGFFFRSFLHYIRFNIRQAFMRVTLKFHTKSNFSLLLLFYDTLYYLSMFISNDSEIREI